ncbi:hypothetical protein D6D17_03152 [Aureobasidium pullulans]|uniref:Uncharacterized protein n=1 Tax=Aureobasidium pullulans TaxID=5580 RepID=A0A4S8XIF9_AURPU|nr:hypothetical protein D6D22_07292 [Aureobasidium pullulans]THX14838.1 hypothetical protein D6D17_03152 [Aureobasidium pullulans]
MDPSDVDPRTLIKLDGSLLTHGSHLEKLFGKDSVHKQILELVSEWAQDPAIIHYTKVNFIKLATIHKAKASNIQDVQLASLLQNVSLAQSDESARLSSPDTECERVIRDCIEQLHWLSKRNIEAKVIATYKNIINSTGYHIPPVINKRNVDDLAGVLIAITSDSTYKASPVTGLLPPGNRFRMNVIVHLALLGGKPANSWHFYTLNCVTFDGFMEKISDTLASGRRGQFERLGYLTQQQKERGVWLSQAAADMESLELQRDAWQVVDESNYKALMEIKDKHVFLIHEYQLGMPARIEEKANNGPKRWNTWALNEHSSFTAPPAPEFLPAADGPVIAPGSRTMIVMSTPRPPPQGPSKEEQQAIKKEKGKERKKRRTQLKLTLRRK